MPTPTLLFRLSARLTPPARTFVHHLHVDLDTASLAAIAQEAMTLASFDKTRASPSPNPNPNPRLGLAASASTRPSAPASTSLLPPLLCALASLSISISCELVSAVYSTGEAEDVGACARVGPDKARRTLILPLARPSESHSSVPVEVSKG